MANAARGEVDVSLGGELRTLRLTYNAAAQIEELTGKGLFEILRQIDRHDIHAKDVAIILWATHRETLVDQNRSPPVEQIGSWILEDGIRTFIPVILSLLMRAFSGSKKESAAPGNQEKSDAASTGTS